MDREVADLLTDAITKEPARLLATLVAVGVVDLRIAIRPLAQGMYHEKIGVFGDSAGDRVSFKGSANETWTAWHDHGNLESIEVFISWGAGNDPERVYRHTTYFDRLWNNEVDSLEVVLFPEAARNRLLISSYDSLDAIPSPPEGRVFPKQRDPLPHQTKAIDSWHQADCRGVLQHATGSGKTFTAILALREHCAAGLPALVLVPSRLLLDQWKKELAEYLPEASLLAVGSGHTGWRKSGRVETFSSASAHLGARIILSTMQTASKPEFSERLRGGAHLMVVADEVHQTGSKENSRIYAVDSGPRLGLSATPQRYGDPEGTERMFAFFGPVVPPEVSLQDAIRAGRLVEYKYHPRPVFLNAEETEEWRRISERISFEVARSERAPDGSSILSERAKLMLIQRSRIAKKAHAKVALAADVLRHRYSSGDRWLVYCEDREQMAEVLAALRAEGIDAAEYYSGMRGDSAKTLSWLDKYGGVVVSIRCLDEGVDIPSVSHALILASSQNPRQFIQRRGRVLRTAPNKYFAEIHDAIVVPPPEQSDSLQLSLAKSELARALAFAVSALNRDAAVDIREIADSLRVTFATDGSVGLEDETDLVDDQTETTGQA